MSDSSKIGHYNNSDRPLSTLPHVVRAIIASAGKTRLKDKVGRSLEQVYGLDETQHLSNYKFRKALFLRAYQHSVSFSLLPTR